MTGYVFGPLMAAEYASLWRRMAIDEKRRATFQTVAQRLFTRRADYAAASHVTGVPVAVIAVIHERESNGNFRTHLHNGDPLTARTVHVPAGRPEHGTPPFDWTDSAIDALQLQNMDVLVASGGAWTVERALYDLERYNGFGYRNKGIRSPYLWGGTNQQQPGKYVRDGVFDPDVMDPQLGCAGLLAALWAIDPTLRLPVIGEGAAPLPPVPAPPAPPPRPAPAAEPANPWPAAPSVLTIIADFFRLIFGGRK